MDVLDPAAGLVLDRELLDRFPVGYRHLGYLQTKAGFQVKSGLPGLTGDEFRPNDVDDALDDVVEALGGPRGEVSLHVAGLVDAATEEVMRV